MAKIRALRRCSLFKDLSFRELALLAPHIEEASVPSLGWVFEAGKPSKGLVIVASGRTRVRSGTSDAGTIDVGPDEFLGELSIVQEGLARGVSAQALEPCQVLWLRQESYDRLRSTEPELAGKVAQGILRSVTSKVELLRSVLPG